MKNLLQPISNKLYGKVAIVTGGASGIGEVTARHFINHGARAVVIADVQDEKGQHVAASLGSQRCPYIHCDITDENHVKSLVESTVSMYGQLDIMFSNAGIATPGDQTIIDMDMSGSDKLFAINARGVAALSDFEARSAWAREVGEFTAGCRRDPLEQRVAGDGGDAVVVRVAGS
ncbi:hypothetical protein FNV43_RR20485 [Rhamnella rubrinervis]|uniref:SDR family NAD(P)-dependent oxidoreductase n=1 Tax=Rhamnella rubrinervis TaxID=2594499 RepID=A0A8K0E0T0_9ROSA|nr:hypothetical protein FNV43_RR20485 [Rhamnella rubrinervis]